MEFQFQRNAFDCLRPVVWEVKSEEQTQEVKLPDAMPDVGKVLGVWGQPLIRSKDWWGNGMGVSGGVMVWILYAPEDGSVPRSVETWIPFQMRWDFPQTERDGIITAACLLRSIDARLISARKLITRAVIEVSGEAFEPVQIDLFDPGELPEDICLLRKSYPIRIPREAGEKIFTLDEELTAPASCEDIQRVIHYSVYPELIDKKIMGDKVVFRGSALIHMLCRCKEGELKTCDFDIPFSQYSELSREFDSYATVNIVPEVTSLELDIQENGILRLKAGLVGQYVVYDRPVVEIFEDAYSPKRSVTLRKEEWNAPIVLEQKQETVKVEQNMEADGDEMIDASVCFGHPALHRGGSNIEMELSGGFQMLWSDNEGAVQSGNVRWQNTSAIPLDQNSVITAVCRRSGRTQASFSGDSATVRNDIFVESQTMSAIGMPVVTGLEFGEISQEDDRPSLILRRVAGDSLWDVAKECGSTVEAIRQVNGITEEPTEGQILLIPIS